MQTLVFAVPEQAQEELRVGLVQPLNSPYNLFVNFDDLIDPNTLQVRFYVYSIGAQRNILWGQYYKTSGVFEIDSGCQYRAPQLYEITRHWTTSGYDYVGNTVTNRPQQRIQYYLNQSEMSYAEYTQLKHLQAYLTGKITEQDYTMRYGPLPEIPEDPNAYIEYLTELEQQIAQYEAQINRVDLNSVLLNKVSNGVAQMLVQIMTQFKQTVEREDYSALQTCPTAHQCAYNWNHEICRLYYNFDTYDFT